MSADEYAPGPDLEIGPFFNGEGWPDPAGDVFWHYQSLAEDEAVRAALAPAKTAAAACEPCAVCREPSEYGIAGVRYCAECAP